MSRIEIILLLILSCFLRLLFGNIFTIFGFLMFINLMAHEVYQYAQAAYVQLVGAFTLKKRLRSYGKWAIVTGCTRGLGLEFSKQLASVGMDIVLMGRNEQVLTKLAMELRSKYGVNTEIVLVDFANANKAIYQMIKEKLRRLEGGIGILVNNVGIFYEAPLYFHEIEEEDILNTVNVNVTPALLLSHCIIRDHMLPRKRGLVVFIGSLASIKPNPLFNAYAASKAYVESLSRSLYEEYKASGVYAQAILPGFVATDMGAYAVSSQPSICMPTAHDYVKSAIASFGMTPITSAYFPHTFLVFLIRGVADWFYTYISRPEVEKMRADHLKKKAEKSK